MKIVKFQTSDSYLDLCVELPPGKRTLLVEQKYSYDYDDYFLPFPWMYFDLEFFKKDGQLSLLAIYVYWSLDPIHSQEANSSFSLLDHSNQFGSGDTCLGEIEHDIPLSELNPNSLNLYLQDAINSWFESPFIQDEFRYRSLELSTQQWKDHTTDTLVQYMRENLDETYREHQVNLEYWQLTDRPYCEILDQILDWTSE